MPVKSQIKRKTETKIKIKRELTPKVKKPRVKKASDFESCKSKRINQVMKLYERGVLIIRGKKVSNQKQAIAIALQQAESGCRSKMNGNDIKNMEDKVKKLSLDKSFTYSDIKRILFLIEYYQKKKKQSQVGELQKRLIAYMASEPDLKKSYRKLILSTLKL